MFGRHRNSSIYVRDFIVANLLRHWTEIESRIQSRPSGKFVEGKKGNHPLILNTQDVSPRRVFHITYFYPG